MRFTRFADHREVLFAYYKVIGLPAYALDGSGTRVANMLALREFVGLWSGWLVVGFMLGGVLGRRSFGGL